MISLHVKNQSISKFTGYAFSHIFSRFLPEDLMVKFFSLGQKAANPRPNPPDQKYSSFTKPLINQVENHFKLFIFQVGIVAAMSGLPMPNVQG